MSSIPIAQPVTGHVPYDEENIPVAQAYVPGSQPAYHYATPVAAHSIPAQQPTYEAKPYNPAPSAYAPGAHEAGKAPPTPYSQYEEPSKPVAAGSLATGAPRKCCGLSRKLFLLVVALLVLIIVGVGVGAGVAAAGGGSKKNSSAGTTVPGQSPGTSTTPATNSSPTNDPPAANTPDATIPIVVLPPTAGTSPNTTPSPPSKTPSPPSTIASPPSTTPSPPSKTPSPPSPSTATGFGTLSSQGQEMVTAINAARKQKGLLALQVDSTLTCTAQQLSENKGKLSNPTCDSAGYPLKDRIAKCGVTINTSINQLTGCEYYTASYQVDSWESDTSLSDVLLDPSFQYVGADGYPNAKFWTAIFA